MKLVYNTVPSMVPPACFSCSGSVACRPKISVKSLKMRDISIVTEMNDTRDNYVRDGTGNEDEYWPCSVTEPQAGAQKTVRGTRQKPESLKKLKKMQQKYKEQPMKNAREEIVLACSNSSERTNEYTLTAPPSQVLLPARAFKKEKRLQSSPFTEEKNATSLTRRHQLRTNTLNLGLSTDRKIKDLAQSLDMLRWEQINLASPQIGDLESFVPRSTRSDASSGRSSQLQELRCRPEDSPSNTRNKNTFNKRTSTYRKKKNTDNHKQLPYFAKDGDAEQFLCSSRIQTVSAS